MKANPYLIKIKENLPRLLGLMDRDETSSSFGMADRFYWAWGLIDFGNGSFQGAAHGMARLWSNGLWPYATDKEQFVRRIDSLFSGASKLTRSNGALEEAFPYEGSYCVTALVAFDLLCTVELLGDEIEPSMRESWLSVVQPMVKYLIKADETHAFISNHLATAVAALLRWHAFTGDLKAESKAKVLLNRILDRQSGEGWFLEYEGADPGYQSLCTYYLADVHIQRPDLGVFEAIRKSLDFLWYFAHPDGSFGGLYGSRNTRFYFPSGILAFATELPKAAVLSRFMAQSIEENTVVTLASMDEPNLVPMFNSYCWAAVQYERDEIVVTDMQLPALTKKQERRYFRDAGLLIDKGENHYSIVSTHKGGVVLHFVKNRIKILNAGVVVKDPKGRLGSNQCYCERNTVDLCADSVQIDSTISAMPKQLPTPLKFIVLRMLCLSFFRISLVREWSKQLLVRLLITKSKTWPVENHRHIQLGENLNVEDTNQLPRGYQLRPVNTEFVPIHMASQGYWQVQDELAEQLQ